jgi:NADH-quinone oxidoreductase subunit F
MSYPEEVFEQRLKRYKAKKRTLLPHQVEIETCRRVNRLKPETISDFTFPDDFAAVQASGSGDGRMPVNLLNAEICFDEVFETAAIKGPGGKILLDNKTCMVDTARCFLDFIMLESCGECTFCRIGTVRMSEVLTRICAGEGKPDDIEMLEDLAEQISTTTLCEVGKTASKPVLSTLRYFRKEYREHIFDQRCRAGTCRALAPIEEQSD